MIEGIKQAVTARKGEWIDFCQRMLRIPSPTYSEGEVADIIEDELKKLKYDEVWQDSKGNILCLIKGTDTEAPAINLNSHMDQVAPGDENDWPHPPFSGHIEEDRIYGRGASDTKGAIAVQTYAPRILMDLDIKPRSTIYLTFVVEEEHWGQGTLYLLNNSGLHFDLSILGEGTSNEIMLGHRGCIGIYVTITGKSAHASMPEKGRNPNTDAARFILRLEEMQKNLKPHPDLGRATLTPTIYTTGDISRNVIPDKVTIYVDTRPSMESRDELFTIIEGIIRELDIKADVEVIKFKKDVEKISGGFSTPSDHPYVIQAEKIIRENLNREVKKDYWQFCTDGRLTAAEGITTFGFSPCEAALAHTVNDSVSIRLMEESLWCYPVFFMEMNKP